MSRHPETSPYDAYAAAPYAAGSYEASYADPQSAYGAAAYEAGYAAQQHIAEQVPAAYPQQAYPYPEPPDAYGYDALGGAEHGYAQEYYAPQQHPVQPMQAQYPQEAQPQYSEHLGYAQYGHQQPGEQAYYAAEQQPYYVEQPYYEEPTAFPAAAAQQQMPYWDDPAYWEAPADPAYALDPLNPAYGIPQQQQPQHYEQPYQPQHEQQFQEYQQQYLEPSAFPQQDAQYAGHQHEYAHGYAYDPAPETYVAPAPMYVPVPEPEPEFDPEPAAWESTALIDPVEDLPMDLGVIADDVDAVDLADDSPRYDPVGASPAAPSRTAHPRPIQPGGRAAARRSPARTPARKSRRPLIAAGGAVVTGAVLAGVVVMQMPDGGSQAQASGDSTHTDDPRATDQAASRDSERPQVQAGPGAQASPNTPVPGGTGAPGPSTLPMPTPGAPLTTTERMKVRFELDPMLALSGKFDTVPGKQTPASTSGRKTSTYRIEIEQGLNLDGKLFAEAVQQTLNDPRSWAHDNRAFVRTDGKADFVIRLASPGTTHKVCSAAGLDTSIQNVSCDAGGTPWVMINAWRWAQGSPTFGDDMVSYRQMLINHEVGHRLGRLHETKECMPSGLAPVMMQQTKTLEADNGASCKPNAWPYPS
ncbi:DUF3152 domain-containing protein [Yinghuangia soli]|uniref:DUF3152 domain-containing protein n=1 Tax=Yinghuangia soli TaxID=2908204 RepID=UPI0027E397C3|nr:DUF3152 domain-containing protein [Yinghuangia soli]